MSLKTLNRIDTGALRPRRVRSAGMPTLVCVAMLATGCIGSDGGGGGGGTVAGVSGTKLVNDLTQEDTTALCMHFDEQGSSIDNTHGCCVATGVYTAMQPDQGSCEEIVAACDGDPAASSCDSGEDPADPCTDPPPTCDGEITVNQVKKCLDDFVGAQEALLGGLNCETTVAEFEALDTEMEMPASCDVVMDSCPEILQGGSESSESASSSGSSAAG